MELIGPSRESGRNIMAALPWVDPVVDILTSTIVGHVKVDIQTHSIMGCTRKDILTL